MPEQGSFKQKIVLLHRSEDAPMVLATNGYTASTSTYRYNLTQILNANQLKVEHRYFDQSRPDPLDWQYLTIEQAANDHHRIVEAIRPFYSGKWVSRGSSKGGMTAMYHRRFFPNDVDGTVANVAPLSFDRLDFRYVSFQNRVADRNCRSDLKLYQREVLKRRENMKVLMQQYADETGVSFSTQGGLDQALDYTVGETYYQFFQYGQLEDCGQIPSVDATDEELFALMRSLGLVSLLSDRDLDRYEAYFYQAVFQLGYPRLLTRHLRDLLMYDPNDYRVYVNEWPDVYDRRAMWDIAYWTALRSTNVIMVYGDIDPWSAAAFYLLNSERRGTHKFMVELGNHGSNITTLNAQDRAIADSMLQEWTGVEPTYAHLLTEQEQGYDEDLYPFRELFMD